MLIASASVFSSNLSLSEVVEFVAIRRAIDAGSSSSSDGVSSCPAWFQVERGLLFLTFFNVGVVAPDEPKSQVFFLGCPQPDEPVVGVGVLKPFLKVYFV
jgi:hypothetical protein